MNSSPDTVDGRPTKSFFVDMLTRDISVADSLLDLCDNALGKTFESTSTDPSDVVLASKKMARPLGKYHLSLDIRPSLIRVSDSCGGIPLDQARDEIFRLGRDADDRPEKGLSVYGIGMKRAFFKLADKVSLLSSHDSEWFEIAFRVSKWKEQPDDDWSLRFTRQGKSGRPSDIPHNGTLIELSDLRDSVKGLLSTKSFWREFQRRLETTYSLFLTSGLALSLNGKRLDRDLPLLADDPVKPARKSLSVGGVKVVIIAGLTPKTVTPTAASSGWYAYCNGRLVLDAEKSRISGWGDGLPQWHNKYSRFVGFVFFSSPDSRLLPWTTTKQGLVDDSDVFQKARQEMNVQARPVLDFLNRLYPGELPPEGVAERALLDKATPLFLNDLKRGDHAFSTPPPKRSSKTVINIHYKKSLAKVDLAREKLGKRLSASDVGSATFDYYMKNELGE
jgi:hypothetical protein